MLFHFVLPLSYRLFRCSESLSQFLPFLHLPEYKFSEIAHSNIAVVPSDKLSDNLDLLWGTVKEDFNTNQLIKYINSPVPTPENIEFLENSINEIENGKTVRKTFEELKFTAEEIRNN